MEIKRKLLRNLIKLLAISIMIQPSVVFAEPETELVSLKDLPNGTKVMLGEHEYEKVGDWAQQVNWDKCPDGKYNTYEPYRTYYERVIKATVLEKVNEYEMNNAGYNYAAEHINEKDILPNELANYMIKFTVGGQKYPLSNGSVYHTTYMKEARIGGGYKDSSVDYKGKYKNQGVDGVCRNRFCFNSSRGLRYQNSYKAHLIIVLNENARVSKNQNGSYEVQPPYHSDDPSYHQYYLNGQRFIFGKSKDAEEIDIKHSGDVIVDKSKGQKYLIKGKHKNSYKAQSKNHTYKSDEVVINDDQNYELKPNVNQLITTKNNSFNKNTRINVNIKNKNHYNSNRNTRTGIIENEIYQDDKTIYLTSVALGANNIKIIKDNKELFNSGYETSVFIPEQIGVYTVVAEYNDGTKVTSTINIPNVTAKPLPNISCESDEVITKNKNIKINLN